MPKYWGKQIFSLGRFPKVGQKQKTEKKERKRDRKLLITMAIYAMQTPPRVAHAKPPGSIYSLSNLEINFRKMLAHVALNSSWDQTYL